MTIQRLMILLAVPVLMTRLAISAGAAAAVSGPLDSFLVEGYSSGEDSMGTGEFLSISISDIEGLGSEHL